MSADPGKIGLRELAGVFWRSLLMQAAWSFERLQSLGFAFAVLPVLRKLYPEPAERASRIREHLGYFNTQPYLASFILGAVARIEQDQRGRPDRASDVNAIKATLAAPLGALGDSFFWGGIKPLAAVLAVALLMPGGWWAPFFFLGFYNIWHLGARAELLYLGFRSSGNAAVFMGRFNFAMMAQAFKSMALAIVGCILGLAPFWQEPFPMRGPLPGAFRAAVLGLAVLVLVAVLRKWGSPIKLMLALAGVSVILAFAGVEL